MRIQINEWTRDQRHRCRQWFATDQVLFIDFLKRQIPKDEQFQDNRYTSYVYQRVLSWRRFTKKYGAIFISRGIHIWINFYKYDGGEICMFSLEPTRNTSIHKRN